MTISTDRLFTRRVADGGRTFVTRRIGPETIVVPVAGQVGDLESVYTLNEIATDIWELLESPRTVRELATLLAADYDATESELTVDIAAFIDVLETSGLVSVATLAGH